MLNIKILSIQSYNISKIMLKLKLKIFCLHKNNIKMVILIITSFSSCKVKLNFRRKSLRIFMLDKVILIFFYVRIICIVLIILQKLLLNSLAQEISVKSLSNLNSSLKKICQKTLF